ncbi:MCE family protein [Actinomadura craniellae]|uniref:MCE family protein n=1 Tax=Actinomadura craniellae TaxID=2231787 RepID=UPI0013146BB3|nr:MlaD family protein [Actinomadura craniellae]
MALKSFRDRDPIVVGLVSLTVLAVALAAAFFTGTLGLLQSRYTMTGVFADTGGLRSGHHVVVAGVQVGEVTAVEPDFARGVVLVTWKVDGDVALGRGTRAEVRTANILGGRFLRLSGPVTAPHLADLPERERRVPLERTQTPITVNDVLTAGTRSLSRLDTATINKVIDQLGGVSAATRERLRRAFSDLAALGETIDASSPRIKRLIADGDQVLRTVNAKDRQLSALARNVQTLLDELRDRQAELSVLLGSGSDAVTRISELISTKQAELIAIIDDLGGTVRTLSPQLDDINTTLAWLGPTLTVFNSSNSHGPWVDAIGGQLGPLAAEDVARFAEMLRQGGR